MTQRPSLFEFAGGESAFLRLAAAHHTRCLQDPVLEHPFSHGGHPEHVQRLASYWAEVCGGPPVFSETCNAQSIVLMMHAGTGAQLEDDMGARFLACFLAALDDAELPDDPEFRAALRAYMEWAVEDVMSYAPMHSTVRANLAVPLWSWDGPVLEPQ